MPWSHAIKKCTAPSNVNPKIMLLKGFPEADLTKILGSTFTCSQTMGSADEIHHTILCELI